jgi:hypothetical protein
VTLYLLIVCRKKLRKEQSLENLALVDRSVKDLSATMQKFEEKEKQARGKHH